MALVEITGIVIAIVCIIYGAVKGVNILVLAPLTAIIVIVTNMMPFFATLIGLENSYMAGLAEFVINFFGVFLLGSILARYIDESGAAESIAKGVLKLTGTKKKFPVLVALFLISVLLTYGGISLFVVMFVLVPLAKPLFQKLNLAWNLVGIPIMLGFGTLTMTMLPGTPSVQNVVPSVYLATTLTAAPLLGLAGALVTVLFSLWFINYTLKKSLMQGKSFADFETADTGEQLLNRPIPPLFLSVLPLLILIVIIIIGSAMEVDQIILIGLTTAIVVSAVVFAKYIPNQKNVINGGAEGSVMPIFLTASSVAFGIVITMAPGFDYISRSILNLPGDPLVSLSVANISFGAITGSSSGALGIVLQAFGTDYLAMGIDAEVIHRVSAIASSVLTVMPHSGVILTLFTLTGLTHKNAFKNLFIGMTGANLLALIVVIIVAQLLY